MFGEKHFNKLENHISVSYRQIGVAVKLFKFSPVLIFCAVLLLSAAQIARADTFIVDRTDDSNVSACTSAANDCTLRGAIVAANTASTDDSIIFDSAIFGTAKTIGLNGGELSIANNGVLTINGTGVNILAIDGNNQSRVFNIEFSAVVNISNLTIKGGRADNFPSNGGGIYNLGTLVVDNSKITGNSAFQRGGGIYSNSDLTVSNSTISNNSTGNSGGGIYNSAGFVRVTSSTINDNVSGTSGGSGGGIRNTDSGILFVTNSTVYHNTGNNGGGISSDGSTFNLMSSTVSNNLTDPNFGVGGGVLSGGGNIRSLNSIIADNNAPNAPDFSGTLISQGYNLIENTSSTVITGITTGNILGQDPLLDPNGLKNNGGATQTVAPLPFSPVIDSADPNNFPAEDQRGVMRPIDGDNNGTALPDIGAFEVERRLIVTKTADTNDGVCDTDCSLREAISAANSDASDNIISFSPSIFNTAQTIILIGGRLNIMNNGSLRIDGSGTDLLRISGNDQSSIFNISGNANVTINDITISDGNSAVGGGILTSGILTLNRVIVTNCKASGGGGGIYTNSNLPVNINFSTIIGNSTSDNGAAGGGIGGDINSSLKINKTTILNNRSSLGGGVQLNSGTIFLTDSLIRNNTATDSGGGVHLSHSGRVIANNSNIIFNSALNEGGGIRANGSIEINDSNINNNTASNGGGIFSFNLLAMKRSTVDGNQATSGGGISLFGTGFSGIEGSTVSNNTATDGAGGIFNNSVGLELANSTVSGNSAGQDGGGINNLTVLRLINATVANNTAVSGGGIINASGTVNARNTIIADNSSEDFFGILNSEGYNLLENTTNTTITSTTSGIIITGQDPQLLPLGDYGGTTKTHALRPTSPAIDKGLLSINLAAIDQRGLPRPFDFPNIPNAVGGDGSDIGAYERQLTDASLITPYDFDGDGKADISVFRPSGGDWYLQQSQSGFSAVHWGIGTDVIVPGDYDGDGKTDRAVFRKSNNSTWYVLRSSGGDQITRWGATNQEQAIIFDTPVPADYDGDGRTDFAVYRLTDHFSEPGRFVIRRSSDGASMVITWGIAGDKPVPADYDGDGKADVAVNRAGTWYILNSGNGQFVTVQFGAPDDKLVPADYDGDGKTDIAVYRPANGTWYYLESGNGNNFVAAQFGVSEDKPVPADYDGDGKADIAVFRPSNGVWYRLNSSNGQFVAEQFGVSEDRPVPNAFVR